MRRRLPAIVATIVALGCVSILTSAEVSTADSGSPATLAESAFDAGTEGWQVIGDPESPNPDWVAQGGNPGGFIETTDGFLGKFMYWVAPDKFLGSKSAAYNGALTFDLRQNVSGSRIDVAFVILSGGGITLRYFPPYPPSGDWTSYSVPLSEQGWTKDGAAASETDMRTVLSSISSLNIRAEYSDNLDIDDLDNVIMTEGSAVADTSVTSADSPDPAKSGSELDYVVTINNAGPDDAHNVALTASLPDGVRLLGTEPVGVCSGDQTLTCALGSLASGSTTHVTIEVEPNRHSVGAHVAAEFIVQADEQDPDQSNNSSSTLTLINECSDTQLSGAQWVNLYPQSRSVADLTSPFRENVQDFIDAMTAAGINVPANSYSTLRPAQRAYLMHYAYTIAHSQDNPANVPDYDPAWGGETPDICWAHHDATGQLDQAASVAAAQQMANAYGLGHLHVAPALPPAGKHVQGLAIDMQTTWNQPRITIVNRLGQQVVIRGGPRNGLNNDLEVVGRSYGVIHFCDPQVGCAHSHPQDDAVHWSNDGH